MSFALKAVTGAVASVVLASSAYAAGLGKLTVLSSLGQPLRAEIELAAVSPEEAQGLSIRLASPEAFRQANIEYNAALMSLRFDIAERNGRKIVRVSSSQPLNEPFVDMLLELSWNSGRLMREYTFLLDPPEMRDMQAAQVAAQPAPAQPAAPAPAQPQPAPAQPQPAPSEPVAKAEPAPAEPQETVREERAPAPVQQRPSTSGRVAAAAPQGEAETYKVRSGDTLGRIARRVKPAGVSLDAMLVALYRANPGAFTGKNMNRLKSGTILTVPPTEDIGSIDAGQARGVVVAHAADFNAYRAKLAGQVAAAEPTATPEAAQSAKGKITARVEERPTAASESRDQLRLSKAAPAATTGSAGKVGASAEDRIARERARAEAEARVKELEKNVSDLEKVLSVKGELPGQAPVAQAPAKPATPATAPAQQAKPPVATPPAQATAPAQAARPAPQATRPATAKPATAKPAAKAAAKRVTEPSLMDMVMENIAYVGAALLVLLLAAFAIVKRRRQAREEAEFLAEPSVLGGATADAPQSLFAHAGGQSIDTSNSVFNSSFAPSASQLDTNEVDPVAEADVYIAYGRDAQAEEILREALRTQPERMPVRMKLLEIYAARKDLHAFEAQAAEIQALTHGQGEDWAQVQALGQTIEPLNPLYGGSPAARPAAAAPKAAAVAAAPAAAAPAAAAPVADPFMTQMAPVTGTAPDDHSLDFDLGGLGLDTPAAPAAPAAQPSAGMSFDLDATAAPASMDFPSPASSPLGESAMADLASSMDLAPAPAKEDNSLDFGSMDFTLPTTPPVSTPSQLTVPTFDNSVLSLDLPGTDGTTVMADIPQPQKPDFDLGSLDLDLPETAAPQAPVSAGDMEMETKLDLAIAYQEIGDKEGARELIDEVIKGGSPEQVAKAKSLKAQLAG